MLGLFLPPTGLGEWVDIPVRTFAEADDPLRGRTAIRTELLGMDDPTRPDVAEAHSKTAMLLRRHDLRNQSENPYASAISGKNLFGPVLFVGTESTFDPQRPDAVRLADLDLSTLTKTTTVRAKNRQHPRLIASPDRSQRRSLLSVRSRAPESTSSGQMQSDFDEVMRVVAEYVTATQCCLSNVQSGALPDGTLYYTATVEHDHTVTDSPTSSTHERTARHGIG